MPDNGFGDFPLDNETSTPDTANPFGGSDGSGSQNPAPSASGSKTGVPDNGFGDFPLDNEPGSGSKSPFESIEPGSGAKEGNPFKTAEPGSGSKTAVPGSGTKTGVPNNPFEN